jgi:carboxymethylenebutenolidase
VARSIEDNGFTEEHATLLRDALNSAGVPNVVEIWPGHHGFAVSDMPVHDPALEERHWETLATFYGERLA